MRKKPKAQNRLLMLKIALLTCLNLVFSTRACELLIISQAYGGNNMDLIVLPPDSLRGYVALSLVQELASFG